MDLNVTKQSDSDLAYTNMVYMNPMDLMNLKSDLVELSWPGCQRSSVVYAVAADPAIERGLVALNGTQRDDVYVPLGATVTAKPYRVRPGNVIQSLTVHIDLRQADSEPIEVQVDKLEKLFARAFKDQVLAKGQKMLLKLKKTLLLIVTALEFIDLGGGEAAATTEERGQYSVGSLLVFKAGKKVKLVGGKAEAEPSRNIFNKNFDFSSMGIGGLDAEFNAIFKRAFASRVYPQSVLDQLGIQHVRGILLYGPPGCGKTLIARQIGKVLNAREPKVVNGPEILDKYVGGSEQKIRDLFAEAEAEQKAEGPNSMLHIIIFDEFDAICKARGTTSDNTGVSDSIVNQLLSKIDGVESINNVLIIGMTNRKDLIDDAVLRPGRLEVHVELGLPDEHGRLQILNIHTAAMRKSKRMTDDCFAKLPELALRSKNYSGAELAGVVRSATANAMDRCLNKETMVPDSNKLCLEFEDFEVALKEVLPKFGAPTADLRSFFPDGLIDYGPTFGELNRRLSLAMHQVENSKRTPLLTVLLEGENMTGKTALAAHAAIQSGFPFVRLINPDSLITMSEAAKCAYLQKVFLDSSKSPLSVIILNDLERIIEYTPVGPRFSNTVLQTLLVLLKKPPPGNSRLLVLATTAVATLLKDVQVVSSFHVKVHVPKLTPFEARKVLEATVPSLSDELIEHVTEPIAIKQLLGVIEMARNDDDTISVDHFVEALHTVAY
jgi:vesicle-fusing ATPase